MVGMTEQAELYRVRSVESDDVALIADLDSDWSARTGVEPLPGRGSASFHARTGHSFIVERDGRALGFLLANAIWTGGRPVVRVERLATGAGDEAAGVARALVAALVKSAYDAGVYDLLAELPAADELGRSALEATDFTVAPVTTFTRTLGSRGQQVDK